MVAERRSHKLSEDIGSGGEQAVLAGHTMVQTTHSDMRAISVQVPRKPAAILQAVLAELEAVPKWAEKCYYDRPIGGGERVVGANVVLTRIVARHWGNCSIRDYVADQTTDKDGVQMIQCAAQFIDLETNYALQRVYPVSSMAWRRSGGYVLLEGEKLSQAVLIGLSKAERNVVLAAIPEFVIQTAFETCRRIAAKSVKGKMAAWLDFFLKKGVTREMLEEELGGSLDKLNDDQLARFKGLANALEDHEMKASDIGGRDEDEPTEDATKTVDQVLGGGATTTDGRELKPAEEPAEEKPEPESPEPATEADPDGDPYNLGL